MTAHFRSTETPFRNNRQVETDIANAIPFTQSALDELHSSLGEFQSTYGTILNRSVNSRLDVSYSMNHLGYSITIPCKLGCILLHKVMCYVKTHVSKPLIFQKKRHPLIERLDCIGMKMRLNNLF